MSIFNFARCAREKLKRNVFCMGQNLLLFAGGVALLMFFLKKKTRDINGLLFSIAGISNVQLNSPLTSFTMFVEIANPTPSDFPFFATNIRGHALLNNSVVLGNASARIDQYLQSGSKILVPVLVSIKDATITAGVISLFSMITTKGANITFDGTVDIAGVTFPLNLNFKV